MFEEQRYTSNATENGVQTTVLHFNDNGKKSTIMVGWCTSQMGALLVVAEGRGGGGWVHCARKDDVAVGVDTPDEGWGNRALARAGRGRGAGYRQCPAWGGAGVARAWRGRGAGMSCSPVDGASGQG
eukprot:gene16767-biopygen5289